ncbi:MAG TPA: serine/threonine-protein kinase, partial [Pirellulaceae bacterium]|nr:serine/threonine-protein kinase [Pirellulaceae bacterium]
AGGMGVVLKAFDTELNRPVAIKVLAPHLAASGAARQRFAREARAAAAVVHEHVVAIHNVESDGTLPFLVMQFVDGEPLQSRIDRLGMLDIATILRIARQTAAGLAAAHSQGLVHRDVKPGNILLVQDVDRALLTDFGLARAADDASLTHTGYHPGTPHYMSPEQARGELIDARSDLFSLGAVLYTMAVGRPPFRAETSFGVLRRITDTAPRAVRELNPQIPEWLAAIIDRLLEKDPAKRVESAARLAQLLESCLAHLQQPLAAGLPDEVVAWTDEWRRRTTAVSSVVPSSSSGSSSHSTSSSSLVGARRSLLRRRDVWAACAALAMLACGAALIASGVRGWLGDTSDEPRTGDSSGRSDVGRANAAS